jgi:iron complex outermembrane recepter protein
VQHASGRPRTKQLTQEFQITSNFDGPFNYVAGVYYLYERSAYTPFSVYGGFTTPPGLALDGDGTVEVKSFAPYFQFDYAFSDKWSLTTGLRYTIEEKDLVSNFVGIGVLGNNGHVEGDFLFPIFPGGPASADNKVDFEEFTPKVTLSYRPNEENMIYLTYARGFKSGGLNLPAFTPTIDAVEPEILDDIEMGWKYESNNIRFNAAAFYYDYKDLQIQITDQLSGGTRVQNAASAEILGFEGDLTWLLTDAFEVGAGVGYTDSEYQDFIGDAYIPCGLLTPATTPAGQCGGGLGLALVTGDLSGNVLTNAPKFSGFLRAQYTATLGNMGELLFSGVLNRRSKAYFDVASLYEDEARTTLSARIAWTDPSDRFSIALSGENLTDKKYHLFNSPQGNGGWSIQAPPRRILLQGSVKF